MESYSISLTQPEIVALRQSLDLINISGKDAKFVAQLQFKLEGIVTQIDQLKQTLEQEKIKELDKLSKEVLNS